MFEIIEKLNNMSDYELGEVAKAFAECSECKDGASCPCYGVLCGVYNIVNFRDYFMSEVAKRLMNTN